MEAALAVQSACTHMVIMVMFARTGGGHGGPHRLPWIGVYGRKAPTSILHSGRDLPPSASWRREEDHREARHRQRRRSGDRRSCRFAKNPYSPSVNLIACLTRYLRKFMGQDPLVEPSAMSALGGEADPVRGRADVAF